jgi:L-ascorbate metabolism protein UlaG (beta-lactamase superfamily)
MRVTKFGHACLLIEEGGAKILIDPGAFSTGQNDAQGVDAILITHEHPDHIVLDSLKEVLKNNPDAIICTNHGVGKLLDAEGISYTLLEDGQETDVKGVSIKGYGVDHACIHDSLPLIRNTGYMIANRLFYPGDALSQDVHAEILALPVAAPWLKISESVDYAVKVKPRVCFPVHDGMLRPDRTGGTRIVPPKVLAPLGIEFRDMVEGSVEEF